MGESTTYGDFDGDGYHDLVVAAREIEAKLSIQGPFGLFLGATRLETKIISGFHQGSDGMPGINETTTGVELWQLEFQVIHILT